MSEKPSFVPEGEIKDFETNPYAKVGQEVAQKKQEEIKNFVGKLETRSETKEKPVNPENMKERVGFLEKISKDVDKWFKDNGEELKAKATFMIMGLLLLNGGALGAEAVFKGQSDTLKDDVLTRGGFNKKEFRNFLEHKTNFLAHNVELPKISGQKNLESLDSKEVKGSYIVEGSEKELGDKTINHSLLKRMILELNKQGVAIQIDGSKYDSKMVDKMIKDTYLNDTSKKPYFSMEHGKLTVRYKDKVKDLSKVHTLTEEELLYITLYTPFSLRGHGDKISSVNGHNTYKIKASRVMDELQNVTLYSKDVKLVPKTEHLTMKG